MRYQGQVGFVLHACPYRETSLLVELLSVDHGRLGVIARGVRGVRRHPLRSALQPLQHIRFDARQCGELAQLQMAEAIDAAPALVGVAAMSAFYVNELVIRLAPRQDPLPGVYLAYARVRTRLALGEAPGWTLRRFERDLLDALGLGVCHRYDGDGRPIEPGAHYRLDPEHGPRRLPPACGGDVPRAVIGRAVLALAADRMPAREDLPTLRRALRGVLAHHLGRRGLKSWELLGALARLTEG